MNRKLILLGVVLPDPIWLFGPKMAPEPPVRGMAQTMPAATSALHSLDRTDEDAPHPTAGSESND